MGLDSTKRIMKALKRSDSYLVSVLIELYSKGINERTACDRLSINYKLYRYTIDKEELLHIKRAFKQARDYKTTFKHEETIRNVRKTIT